MISVVTPSLNQSQWLRLAVASVADQSEVRVEHIVQDALSSDGTRDWLATDPRVKPFFEKDEGMYDAVNRGLDRAQGEICAYLNCDEQYLPGALANVSSIFDNDTEVDVLIAGSIVVNRDGSYVCSRPSLQPSLRQLRAGRMYNLTSSIFFRSRVFREKGLRFDPTFRVVGDLDWLYRVAAAGCCIRTIQLMTSTFSDLGNNLALTPKAVEESNRIGSKRGALANSTRSAMTLLHRASRLLQGHYHLKPHAYSIYTLESPDARRTFHVAKPTGVWANRL